MLQDLATKTGKQHQEILHEALDAYQRDKLLDGINAGFERLRSDKAGWAQEMSERQLWDATLEDGTDD
ncbi:MAG: toxin-antitoxin system protein [Gemmatimonadales bacterium]